jgi:hypothetical protein
MPGPSGRPAFTIRQGRIEVAAAPQLDHGDLVAGFLSLAGTEVLGGELAQAGEPPKQIRLGRAT